jgi:o-succinylbenzoate synthase
MEVEKYTLTIFSKRLKIPFSTHLETVHDRAAILVEIEDKQGLKGYGEVVAFSSPWYTEETVETCLHMLKDFFLPFLAKQKITHPSEITPLLDRHFRRNQMAKAAIETAYWDLYAKSKELSLATLLGGTKKEIPAGVVVGTNSVGEAIRQIELYLKDGYQRVKVKIHPENDVQIISRIRSEFPNLAIMADANSAYTIDHLDQLKALDEFGLLMIEQPLAHDDIIDHALLQKELKTPICLDESIVTFDDARKAIQLGSCRVINIKIGRVGGLSTAIKIHDYTTEHGIDVWCGGMLEYGVSRAHNIALASLPGFIIPGDISASSRYWEEDIVDPEVVVRNGFITVPEGPGIGFSINVKSLAKSTIYQEVIKC